MKLKKLAFCLIAIILGISLPASARIPLALASAEVVPLLLPFQFGQGRILYAYESLNHTGGDDFALDLCEGAGCTQSMIGQFVLAPTDMILIYSGRGFGMPVDALDYHIFEISNDGTNKLCLSLGHFQISLPGLIPGKGVPRSAVLGQLTIYPGSVAHIHLGAWRSPVATGCDGAIREALPFTGILALDGISYYPGPEYSGLTVASHNLPVCAIPAEANTKLDGVLGVDPGACVMACPQSGGSVLYKNALYACNSEPENFGFYLRNNTGLFDLPDGMNNHASSASVLTGWSVMLYEGRHRAGGRLCINSPGIYTFQGENFDNGSDLTDSVSSIEVFASSGCPLPVPDNVTFDRPSAIYIQPGSSAHPVLDAHVWGGVLDPVRGDRLSWAGGDKLSAPLEHPVTRLVNEGETYQFEPVTHPAFRFIAPNAEGSYHSQWQIKVFQAFIGESVDIQMVVDGTPPEVSLPDPGVYLTGEIVPIQVIAQDSLSGIDQIQFFVGYDGGTGWSWHPLGWDADGSDGYHMDWDVSQIVDQPGIALYVYAWDKAGNGADHVLWDRVLDRQPPTTMLSPLPAVSDSSALVLNWQGSDSGSGLASVDIQMQSGPSSWVDWMLDVPAQWNQQVFVGDFDQQYKFRIRGTDRSGQVENYPGTAEAVSYIQPCQPDAYEPDGNLSQANIQQSDGSFTRHTFCGTGDEDWIRFWVVGGESYTFETINLGSTTDTIIELYNGQGALLAVNDNASLWRERASRLSWQASQNGWLYLRTRHTNSRIAGEGVAYDIRVRQGTWSWLSVIAGTISP